MSDLLIGILAGLVSGWYTGLVMSRYAIFIQLKNELMRIVRIFPYIVSDDNSYLTGLNWENLDKIIQISCDLHFYKHTKAGNEVAEINKDIHRTHVAMLARKKLILSKQPILDDSYAKMTPEEAIQKTLDWQTRINELEPSIKTLISLDNIYKKPLLCAHKHLKRLNLLCL